MTLQHYIIAHLGDKEHDFETGKKVVERLIAEEIITALDAQYTYLTFASPSLAVILLAAERLATAASSDSSS